MQIFGLSDSSSGIASMSFWVTDAAVGSDGAVGLGAVMLASMRDSAITEAGNEIIVGNSGCVVCSGAFAVANPARGTLTVVISGAGAAKPSVLAVGSGEGVNGMRSIVTGEGTASEATGGTGIATFDVAAVLIAPKPRLPVMACLLTLVVDCSAVWRGFMWR